MQNGYSLREKRLVNHRKNKRFRDFFTDLICQRAVNVTLKKDYAHFTVFVALWVMFSQQIILAEILCLGFSNVTLSYFDVVHKPNGCLQVPKRIVFKKRQTMSNETQLAKASSLSTLTVHFGKHKAMHMFLSIYGSKLALYTTDTRSLV